MNRWHRATYHWAAVALATGILLAALLADELGDHATAWTLICTAIIVALANVTAAIIVPRGTERTRRERPRRHR